MDIWRTRGMSKEADRLDYEYCGQLRECVSTEQLTFIYGDDCVSSHVRRSNKRRGYAPPS